MTAWRKYFLRKPSNGIGRHQETSSDIRNITEGIKEHPATAADIKIHQTTSREALKSRRQALCITDGIQKRFAAGGCNTS
jgi:hypothetical protein